MSSPPPPPSPSLHRGDPPAGPSSQDSSSDSSGRDRERDHGRDQGLRMSPAAARRFARRRLRRPSATPDLVTSLVRPPSPDVLYATPDLRGRVRDVGTLVSGALPPYASAAATARFSSSRPLSPGRARVRSGPLLAPHPSSLDIPSRYGGGAIFDMYALSYVDMPDPNLLCPICHDPLVDPVTTPCDHTFCYRCLRRSIASSPSGSACPVDRESLCWSDCFSASRIARTQLANLRVRCPHHQRGCLEELRRDAVEGHATSSCPLRELSCPAAGCLGKVRSEPANGQCTHHEANCLYCGAKLIEADRDGHLISCPKTKTRCQGCWQLIYRSHLEAHRDLECDGLEVGCPHRDVGCPVRALRRDIGLHAPSCAFHPESPSGIVIRSQRDIIQSFDDLRGQVGDMELLLGENSRRIDEAVLMLTRGGVAAEVGVGVGGGGGGGNQHCLDPAFGDARTLRDLDAGFEEVHQNLTHLEARQSMWTLNQVMPIREEVTELRNNMNMIRMHVNWLLNRTREEGRLRAANTTASPAAMRREGPAEGGVAPPALPERRRPSDAETDVARL